MRRFTLLLPPSLGLALVFKHIRDSINDPRVFRIASPYHTTVILALMQSCFRSVHAFHQWQDEPNTRSAPTDRSDGRTPVYHLDICDRSPIDASGSA
jgi:hypothetical protein